MRRGPVGMSARLRLALHRRVPMVLPRQARRLCEVRPGRRGGGRRRGGGGSGGGARAGGRPGGGQGKRPMRTGHQARAARRLVPSHGVQRHRGGGNSKNQIGQRTLIELSVRPGRSLAISAQRLPRRRCARRMISSSSADHASLQIEGLRWLCQRSRHCDAGHDKRGVRGGRRGRGGERRWTVRSRNVTGIKPKDTSARGLGTAS